MSSATVLLADDNPELRAFLRTQLTEHYDVRVAATGREAWRKMKEAPPDLVVSDAAMPELDGVDLCRRMQNSPSLRGIPVILLPAPTDDREKTVHRVADAVLPKPFRFRELQRRVGRYLPSPLLPDTFDETVSTFLKEVIGIIEQHLHDPQFTVKTLAEALDLSRRHLTRRLKEEADTTPGALIQRRRIERAKARLEANPNTIKSVAEAVGFQSASHFSKCFRNHVGCAPTTYVERHASDPDKADPSAPDAPH